jgi:hypothetical protein
MPGAMVNHIHLAASAKQTDLNGILRGLKSFAAKETNKAIHFQ